MKRILFLVVALACISFSEAKADYTFTFNNDLYGFTGSLTTPSNGSGPLTVSGGSVIGTGSANIGVSYSYIVPPSGGSIRPFGATDLIFDGQLSPGSDPVLTGNGLVFKSSDGLSYLNVWGIGPSSYTTFQLGYNTITKNEIYGPQVNGTVDLTPTPLPAAVWLFGSGLVGLARIRRRGNIG